MCVCVCVCVCRVCAGCVQGVCRVQGVYILSVNLDEELKTKENLIYILLWVTFIYLIINMEWNDTSFKNFSYNLIAIISNEKNCIYMN